MMPSSKHKRLRFTTLVNLSRTKAQTPHRALLLSLGGRAPPARLAYLQGGEGVFKRKRLTAPREYQKLKRRSASPSAMLRRYSRYYNILTSMSRVSIRIRETHSTHN